MKKILKRLSIISIFFFPLLVVLLSFVAVLGGKSDSGDGEIVDGVNYVEHWSGKDAYSHHFLYQRYGITSEQIDSFIKSQGYDPVGRASGKEFLKAQEKSGIDVRVLVAFAQMESSYGTAGVARQYPEANIWGYGCVDNDPDQGRFWGPERAFLDFRKTQIETFGNTSCQIMDERAHQYAAGTLPAGKAVYYTDTSGTGKARASIMEKLDKWIDDHGGTPKPPASKRGRKAKTSKISGDFAHVFDVPYKVVQPYGKTPWSQGGGAWMYPMGHHSGVDLQGEGFESHDVPMYSATDGKLFVIGPDPMGGFYLVIEPPFGGYIYYGHMKSAEPIPQGAAVKKGQRIGVMGTGAGVYHVHFEYNKDIRTIGRANSLDEDPSFLVQKSGTLVQDQVIDPNKK